MSAIANDSTTGGSNISMCQLRLDGGAFANMNASDGAYSSVSEAVNYSLGTLANGTHTLGIRCNDSAGNTGAIYNLTFNVTRARVKNILFVTLSNSPSTAESRWITWLGSHTSNISLNWSYDQTAVSNVTGGSVNVSNYRIVAMADAPSSDAIYYSTLNSYKAGGNYVVLLGASLMSAISNLGVGTGLGNNQNTKTIVPRASHYITSGYTINTSYDIQAAASTQWYHTNFTGTNIISLPTSTRGFIMQGSNVLTYGATRPDSFNANGNTFATRVFDWAINSSAP
ncbi:Uncharacterised protein [uncultured archaeon]|nr:Uncharacterised protein [uncultured archaeon]